MSKTGSLEILSWCVVIGASLIAAVYDIKSRRIPNWLCVSVLAGGLIWASWMSGLSGLKDSAATALILGFPFVLLFLFAGGGAGDAKLMAAIGSWLGINSGMIALAAISIAGLIQALAAAAIKGKLKEVINRVGLVVYIFLLRVLSREKLLEAAEQSRPAEMEKMTVPYAVAIFVGTCAAAGVKLLW